MKQKYPLLLLFLISACTSEPNTQEEELYSLLEGSFVSEKQSEKNSKYYNITLRLAHIWEDREGLWVYAEYGLTNTPEQPYDQRIYKIIKPSKNVIAMESYELDDWEKFIGMWNEPSAFNEITETEISLRQGCKVIFEKTNDAYIGKTEGRNCSRGLGKADYSIQQVRISEDQIVNCARGFDEDDNLVWGLSDGGYVLDKIKEL